MIRFLSLAKIVAALSFCIALASPAQNGNWWKEKSPTARDAFVCGYKMATEHQSGHGLQISKFNVKELSAGLDSFYSDFRNRAIRIDEAIFYVADQLSGVSDEKLNAKILKLRAAAAASNTNDTRSTNE